MAMFKIMMLQTTVRFAETACISNSQFCLGVAYSNANVEEC